MGRITVRVIVLFLIVLGKNPPEGLKKALIRPLH